MAENQVLEMIREDIRRIEGKMDAHIHDSSWIMERISRLEAESRLAKWMLGGVWSLAIALAAVLVAERIG